MLPERNVVLTGFMGTGKSTVGRALAFRLGSDFVDTDELIEARYGPIAQIFTDQGEEAFRRIEQEIAAELGGRSGLVIATGGRMALDPDSRAALSRHGQIFCLVATPEAIYERVTEDQTRQSRPLLQVDDPFEQILTLMSEREQKYRRFPQVETDGRDPEEIVETIIHMLDDTSIDPGD